MKKICSTGSDQSQRKELVDIDDNNIDINRQAELLSINRTSFYRDLKITVNRKNIRHIVRDMEIYTIYPKPNFTKWYYAQYKRPYLLRNLHITHPDQVWGIDITYIRMNKGFMYLFIIIDWHSWCIVDYEVSNTLEKAFVINCLKRALSKEKPEIIHSDQGSHFINPKCIAVLESEDVRISMDGKSQALDNVRTERFFRSIKYDKIYINEYDTPKQLR